MSTLALVLPLTGSHSDHSPEINYRLLYLASARRCFSQLTKKLQSFVISVQVQTFTDCRLSVPGILLLIPLPLLLIITPEFSWLPSGSFSVRVEEHPGSVHLYNEFKMVS